jgi:hypothetical protein
VNIPAIDIPAVDIPAVDIPAITVPGNPPQHYPAQHYPAQHYPAQDYPAQHYSAQHYSAVRTNARHLARTCIDAPAVFSPVRTAVRVSHYAVIDPQFASTLTARYWSLAGSSVSSPDPTAAGFGQVNAAGFPKNQYVRSYVRRDGTFVGGYWRNSPTDGLPTCRIISC